MRASATLRLTRSTSSGSVTSQRATPVPWQDPQADERILASMAAASFQHELRRACQPSDAAKLSAALPHFDARVFQLPSKVEAANALLWRAMNARKNAVTSATRAIYSAKAMHGIGSGPDARYAVREGRRLPELSA
jgi:hypothetical protein